MTRFKTIYSCGIMLALTVCVVSLRTSAQNTENPQIVGEFTTATCEDVLASTDALFFRVLATSGSRGIVTIPESIRDPLENLKIESVIRGAIIVRGINRDLVRIVRTDDSDQSTKFWFVQPGEPPPTIIESKWNLRLSLSKARLFFSENPMFDSVCFHSSVDSQFAELLIANPKYRGNIVLREPSPGSFNKRRAEVIKWLDPVLGSRLRFFLFKQKDPGFEYWLARPKQQK